MTKTPVLDLESVLTGLPDESTLSKLAELIERLPQILQFARRINAALALCGIHLDGNGTEVGTPVALALTGPLHEDHGAAEKPKNGRRGAKKGVRPKHLDVKHVCPGKRFGCTKVIWGNSYKLHEKTCSFLNAGLKGEKEAGVPTPKKTRKARKAAVAHAKAGAKKKAA